MTDAEEQAPRRPQKDNEGSRETKGKTEKKRLTKTKTDALEEADSGEEGLMPPGPVP